MQVKFIGDSSNTNTNSIDDNGIDHRVPNPLPSSSPWVFRQRFDSTYSSIAVRGATCARPEGYCKCWDKEDADLLPRKDQNWMTKRNQRRQELQREVR